MNLTPAKGTGRYISIKADGLFHEKSEQGVPGAKKRTWELKDGTKGEKWELLYSDIKDVYIKDVAFEDSDFGENLLIMLTDGNPENDIILAESTASNFGTDLMKKLPNIIFSEKLTLRPYAFETEEGKERRGVTILQGTDENGDEKKLKDFFWDGEQNLHGIPQADKTKTHDKDDWRIHFINVKKFLTNYTKENIIPKIDSERVFEKPEAGSSMTSPVNESDPTSDIPF